MRVDTAYHSAHMDPIRDALGDALADLSPTDEVTRLYSSVSGAYRPGSQWGAEYWWNNVRRPVRMQQALTTMLADGYNVFLELGAHPVLSSSIKQTAAALDRTPCVVHSLDRRANEVQRVLRSLAELYTVGVAPRWRTLQSPAARLLPLPHYAFQRERHWRESALSVEDRLGCPGSVFFHQRVRTHALAWHVELTEQFFPYLPDHKVLGVELFPGAGYVSAMLELNRKLFEREHGSFEQVEFLRVLAPSPRTAHTLETSYDPASGRISFHSSSFDGDRPTPWRLHAQALLAQGTRELEGRGRVHDPNLLRADCVDSVTPSQFYAELSAMGLQYGVTFRSVQELHVGPGRAIARLEAPLGSAADTLLDPVLLDGALQVMAYSSAQLDGGRVAFIPTSVARIDVLGRIQSSCLCMIDNLRRRLDTLHCDIVLLANTGEELARLTEVTCQRVSMRADSSLPDCTYGLVWAEEALATSERTSPGRVLVLATADDQLVPALGSAFRGAEPIVVSHVLSVEHARGHRSEAEADPSPAFKTLYEEIAPNHIVYCLPADADLTTATQTATELFFVLRVLEQVRDLCVKPIRVDLVARRVHRVVPSDGGTNVGAAALFDLIQVVNNEFPDVFQLRAFDVDDKPASWAALGAELGSSAGPGAPTIAYRDGHRFTWQLQPTATSSSPAAPSAITRNATYLITGGTRGFGLEVGRWLARRGAGHIVLSGRGGTVALEDQQVVAEIEEAGARVTVVQLDVRDRVAVARLIEQIDQPDAPLRGIFHAAAAYDDRLLGQLDRAAFDRVFAPKATGLENIDAAIITRAVAFVVCFSSISAVIGNRGQAAYVAANAFMDAFARRARVGSVRYHSINWGVLAETGFAARSQLLSFLNSIGLVPLSTEECLAALDQALLREDAQLVVARIDRGRFASAHPQLVRTDKFRIFQSELSGRDESMTARLIPLSANERSALVLRRVRELLAGVLKMAPERIDIFASMDGLGVDSLKALELVTAFEQAFQTQISVLDMLASPTVEELSTRLLQRLLPEELPEIGEEVA